MRQGCMREIRYEPVFLGDAITGQRLMSLKGRSEDVEVWSIAFSPDGKRLASGSWDQTVKVWDAGDGRELMTLKGHSGGVASVAFSPDGRKIASGALDGTILIFPAADWE